MWFAASLLFENVVDQRPTEERLWENRIVLINADNEETAGVNAERIALEAQHSYEAATGELINVTFRSIESVYQIQGDDLAHGTELFSRFLRASEVRSLLTRFGNND